MKTNSFLHSSTGTKRSLICILLISVLSITGLQAQVYKLSASKDNIVKVSGTSNVHDWKMTAMDPVCEADFGAISATDGIPKSLNALTFSVNAKSLKSESSSMDNRTYKTIKADTYPKISFKLSNAVITPTTKNKFAIKATGALTLAGVTKTIVMQLTGEVKADQTITCTGVEKLKLTEYSIQPPSFMLGAMKVGDELTISYNLNFKK
ncbi:YceI family protein [Pedobacter metabolipauper]|uniref:Polyisoprenoid-binding protein YceI n=1 Tax=Pedobacter metabolipauper TaxID=425513 RepID=A0A4R6SYE5_9SPHI|nr:YceI family protein [Pedobacter metabolipauper]TDQ11436.1 polyisoprenoid-binding protein YceI [Pedobacter metabolipauper]